MVEIGARDGACHTCHAALVAGNTVMQDRNGHDTCWVFMSRGYTHVAVSAAVHIEIFIRSPAGQ